MLTYNTWFSHTHTLKNTPCIQHAQMHRKHTLNTGSLVRLSIAPGPVFTLCTARFMNEYVQTRCTHTQYNSKTRNGNVYEHSSHATYTHNASVLRGPTWSAQPKRTMPPDNMMGTSSHTSYTFDQTWNDSHSNNTKGYYIETRGENKEHGTETALSQLVIWSSYTTYTCIIGPHTMIILIMYDVHRAQNECVCECEFIVLFRN